MITPRAWFSHVVFQPALDAGSGISLGFLVELATTSLWGIAAVMRGTLAEEKLAGLDEISRALIDHRVDVVKKEMDHILDRAKKPGEALALLASANPWSFKITPPQDVKVEKATPPLVSADGIQELLEGYVTWIYTKEWLPSVRAREASVRVNVRTTPTRAKVQTLPIPSNMPEPWMLPPAFLWRPLTRL